MTLITPKPKPPKFRHKPALTVIVHMMDVQYCGREAPRRAGLTAAAETCLMWLRSVAKDGQNRFT